MSELTYHSANKQTENNSQSAQANKNKSVLQDNREHTVQKKILSDARSAPVQRNNTGMPDKLKTGIENLSGINMDHVKVHYNSAKPAQLNAHAYAQGSHIHLAPGQEKHLPHEAWHVVQQSQGRVKPTMQMKAGVPVNDDAGLEKEADVMGARAVANNMSLGGHSKQMCSKLSPIVVQRNPLAAIAPWAPHIAAGLAFGYLAYRGVKYGYEKYQQHYAPELEEKKSRKHFEQHGYTPENELENPYLLDEHKIRQFKLKSSPAAFTLSPLSYGKKKYLATALNISHIHLSRGRMITGHRMTDNPQGHHLFSFEALMSGIESFNGPLSKLVGTIGSSFVEYERVEGQNKETIILIKNALETVHNMLNEELTIEAWQTIIAHLLETFIQANQLSQHSTSGHGKGAQNEGYHIEQLRKLELNLQDRRITEVNAVKEAEEHINKIFDLHASTPLSHRNLAQKEGMQWLSRSYPLLMAAYKKKS